MISSANSHKVTYQPITEMITQEPVSVLSIVALDFKKRMTKLIEAVYVKCPLMSFGC